MDCPTVFWGQQNVDKTAEAHLQVSSPNGAVEYRRMRAWRVAFNATGCYSCNGLYEGLSWANMAC